MEQNRLNLQDELENLLGSKNVYFQPPESVKMVYPAIVYSRTTINNTKADDTVYLQRIEYNVIVLDYNPDSEIVEKMSMFRYAKHVNSYALNGLHHDVFKIIY